MEIIAKRLDEIINFIGPLLPLANAHMVNFITDDLWSTFFPCEMKEESCPFHKKLMLECFWEGCSVIENNSKSREFVRNSIFMSVNLNDGICLGVADLKNKITMLGHNCCSSLRFEQFMSEKKIHEVEIMSFLVATLTTLTGASHVLDIGGGKGYLSSILALEYKLKVLGIDSSDIKIKSALKRADNLKKVWRGSRKKYSPIGETENTFEAVKVIEGTKFRQSTEFVNERTNLLSLVVKEFPEDSNYRLGITGLHTCGNLASVCLKQFIENDIIDYVVNVGCCHHLIDEEFKSHDTITNYGFPLSEFLRKKKFSLGRNARMLSLQALPRISSHRTVPSESLMYRAVLQQLLVNKLGGDYVPRGQVGRIAEKCGNFIQYVHKALNKLGLDIEISDQEIEDVYRKYEPWKDKLQIFFMLRASLAPVLESIILLDRLLFMKEQGIEHSYLVQMFDPVVSPRCYGIVAFRDKMSSFPVKI